MMTLEFQSFTIIFLWEACENHGSLGSFVALIMPLLYFLTKGHNQSEAIRILALSQRLSKDILKYPIELP